MQEQDNLLNLVTESFAESKDEVTAFAETIKSTITPAAGDVDTRKIS